jgi:hypothetical protein
MGTNSVYLWSFKDCEQLPTVSQYVFETEEKLWKFGSQKQQMSNAVTVRYGQHIFFAQETSTDFKKKGEGHWQNARF